MSQQPKLYPKSHVPIYPRTLYGFDFIAPDAGLGHQGVCGEQQQRRVFRVKRKHVLKACDRCRAKKTKCDGKQPCNRCSAYNHPCLFRERKTTHAKVYSQGFVEMLESHHSLVVKALQKLYKYCINKEGFPGEPLAEAANGHPLTHAILDRLGLIKKAEQCPDGPDEDAEDLQYLRLLSTSADSGTASNPSSEPVTPTEVALNTHSQLNISPHAANEQWTSSNWPDQRYEYTDNQCERVPSRLQLGPTTSLNHSALTSAGITATTSQVAPQVPGHDALYLYCLDQCHMGTGMKHQLLPDVLSNPCLHQPGPVAPELQPSMLTDYRHLHLQDQSLYSVFTSGWHLPPEQ